MSSNENRRCPACGKPSNGNFCRHCGNALGATSCTECGAALNGRFCSECGAPSRRRDREKTGPGSATPGRRGSGELSWWVAGGGLFAVAVALGVIVVGGEDPQLQAASGTLANPAPANLAQMTPREAADQLFNRVMTASDNGDTSTVAGFLPLALRAYESARPLDMDGLFHMALLQRTGGDPESSLASAEAILAEEPNHILGLNAAAKAALGLGRNDAAADYYGRILASVDAEMVRPLPEYQAHSRYFEVSRQEALTFLGSR